MALEDIKRNAKRDIESSIKEYLKGHKDQSTYNYIVSKIDLAAQVSLITVDETKEYMDQIRK
jgi:hypothetical protein